MTADALGGVWQYATDLAAGLTRNGNTVTLALLGPGIVDLQTEEFLRQSDVRLIRTDLPVDWLCESPETVRAAAGEIVRLARSEAVDLVHCNMPTLAAERFPVPLVAVTHGCVATWWQAAKQEPLDEAFSWHREMMRQGLCTADAVVAPSASYAATVRSTYGLAAKPLTVHNGRASLPSAASSEPPANAALAVGRWWDPVKNAAALDRAAAKLDLPFFAAGKLEGPHGECVSFQHMQALGQLGDAALAEMLALRPIFVSAATFEPFGLAVLEAAQAGCALVLSDIGTFRELWSDAAIFVDPADPDAIAQAVRSLVADPDRRRKLGEAAALRAADFTVEAMAAAMTSIYARLLAPREAVA